VQVSPPGKAAAQPPAGEAGEGASREARGGRWTAVRGGRWARWTAVRGLGDGAGRLPVGTATWLGSFLTLTAVLLVRNAYLFSAKIYERGDFAANTVAVLQAKHFDLLTGNYSKEGFYHPGPAFLYVAAAGESFFHDLLHVVPTPWNGQLLAILLLNAALIAASLAVLARHAGLGRVTLAGLVVVLIFAAVHPMTVNSPWMPYVYFAPALLLLVSAASVAAGQTADLPLLALAAGLSVNGQAEFLLFAPVTVLVALGALIAAHRRDLRGMFSGRAWHWAGALAVTALLAFPIVVNTALHWPGQFGNYLTYTRNVSAHHLLHHSWAFSVAYTLRYWWPGTPARTADIGGLYVAGLLGVVALALALRCRMPGLRRFLLWSLAMAGLMSVLFIYYASRGIDDSAITQAYLGYFYWAAPLLVALVAAAAAAVYLDGRRAASLALAGAVAGGAVIATVVPQHRDNVDDPQAKYLGVPQLPHIVKVLAAEAGGRPMVLRIVRNDWGDTVGVLAYADRTGLRACVAGSSWTVLFRAQSVCTRSETRAGVSFWFTLTGPRRPPANTVVATFPQTKTLVTRQPVP
jgi:hypothetical protein